MGQPVANRPETKQPAAKPADAKPGEEKSAAAKPSNDAWRGFKPGLWQRDVNVRWFLQSNYTPYDGDSAFLAPATERTKGIWKKLAPHVDKNDNMLIIGVTPMPPPITAITGKDMSFSGRTQIWDIVTERIAQHPLLGGGYGAYWTGDRPESQSYEFLARMNFYPTQTHNGYLDVINDLGVPGALFLLGFLVVYVRQALALMRANLVQSALYLGLLFQQLVGNLSEARWFSSLSVDFAIMTVASLAMSRILLNYRLRDLGTVSGAGAHAQ